MINLTYDFTKHKFRASQIGNLMPGPKAKAGELQETERIELLNIYLQCTYGFRRNVSTLEMRKGIIQESESLALIAEVIGKPCVKNQFRYEGDFLAGTPDIILPELVIDAKTSWDLYTFRKAEMTKTYFWQLQAYMYLTDRDHATLAYCLVDAPESFIESEIRKRLYYDGILDDTSPEADLIKQEVRSEMVFSHIPAPLRLRNIDVEHDVEKIKEFYWRRELWVKELLLLQVQDIERLNFKN